MGGGEIKGVRDLQTHHEQERVHYKPCRDLDKYGLSEAPYSDADLEDLWGIGISGVFLWLCRPVSVQVDSNTGLGFSPWS